MQVGSSRPINKVNAAGLTGAVLVILTWVLGQYGITLPTEVVVAIATVFMYAAAYFTPIAPGEIVDRSGAPVEDNA